MLRSRELVFAVALLSGAAFVPSMQPVAVAQAAPHQSGTVKVVSSNSFTLTTQAGQDVTITVPASAKVVVVAPGAKTLAGATSGSISDIAPGDRALVSGATGEAGPNMTAVRVILMKASAIEQSHAAEEQAWAQGVGGIVKTVDPATGTIGIVNGMRKITVHASPQTVVRRYANGSVRFQDAVASSLASVQPGDQLRVRGTKSPDGSSIQADEIVVGTFGHYSGLITAVNPSAGTITLKDLATKRPVTVTITSNSDLHQLPPAMAQQMADRMKGGAGEHQAGRGDHAQPAGAGEETSEARSSRTGVGLSNMMSRLPPVTLAELKPGDAVMIVAATPADGENPAAITLLSGVDPLLRAPSGQTMQLSPWNMGGGAAGGGGGDEGGGGDAGGGAAGGPGGGSH